MRYAGRGVILLDQPGADPDAAQAFDLADRGLLLADGVFDTSLIASGRMIWRSRHTARLLADAEALGIRIEPGRLDALIDRALAGAANGALRVTATRGPAGRGLAAATDAEPTLMARLSPDDPAARFAPLTLRTSAITRNPASPAARHKTLAYLDNVLAQREAAAAGADQALMLNVAGRVACAAAGNLFARFGQTLVTPPVEEGALPGVTRAWILERAAGLGWRAEVRPLDRDEFSKADQLFVTNSLKLIAPVSKLDGAAFDPSRLASLQDALAKELEHG